MALPSLPAFSIEYRGWWVRKKPPDRHSREGESPEDLRNTGFPPPREWQKESISRLFSSSSSFPSFMRRLTH